MSLDEKSSTIPEEFIKDFEESKTVRVLYSGKSGIRCFVGSDKYEVFLQLVSAVQKSKTIEDLYDNDPDKIEDSLFLENDDLNLLVFTDFWNVMNGATLYMPSGEESLEDLVTFGRYYGYFGLNDEQTIDNLVDNLISQIIKQPENADYVNENEEEILNIIQLHPDSERYMKRFEKRQKQVK